MELILPLLPIDPPVKSLTGKSELFDGVLDGTLIRS